MSKETPLYIRLYSQAAYYELIRIIGYAGLPMPEAREQVRPLAEKYSPQKMDAISREVLDFETNKSPGYVRLKPEVRKLCGQLLGLPPEAQAGFSSPPAGSLPLSTATETNGAPPKRQRRKKGETSCG